MVNGFWSDAGTWPSHERATDFIKQSMLDKEIMDRYPMLKDWETWHKCFEK